MNCLKMRSLGASSRRPRAKKFSSLIRGRNLDAKAREELQKLVLSFKRHMLEPSAGGPNKENPLQASQQEGAVLTQSRRISKRTQIE